MRKSARIVRKSASERLVPTLRNLLVYQAGESILRKCADTLHVWNPGANLCVQVVAGLHPVSAKLKGYVQRERSVRICKFTLLKQKYSQQSIGSITAYSYRPNRILTCWRDD